MAEDNTTDTEGNEEEESSEEDSSEQEEKAKPEARFTQKDLDRLISERLKREGIKDLKTKAAEYDKLKAETQTEAERAAAEAEEAKKVAADKTERLRIKSLDSAVAKACATLGVEDIELVQALIERAGVDYDDNDEPVGIADRVKEIVKTRPALKGSKFLGGGDGGQKPKQASMQDMDTLEGLSMEEYMAVRNKK